MPKVRLIPTDDPQVFELEELDKPTEGDLLHERLDDQRHKFAEQDSLLGRILMRLDALEAKRDS